MGAEVGAASLAGSAWPRSTTPPPPASEPKSSAPNCTLRPDTSVEPGISTAEEGIWGAAGQRVNEGPGQVGEAALPNRWHAGFASALSLAASARTFEGGGTLRLWAFMCLCGGSEMGGSMPGSFIPGDAASLAGGSKDSWPGEELAASG